jgi:hypothetical protein
MNWQSLVAAKVGKETFGDAIDQYIATSRKALGRTKVPTANAYRMTGPQGRQDPGARYETSGR